MADILRDVVLTVDGTDVSDYLQECSMETTKDEVEVTAMGAVNKVYLPGLGDATISCTFFNDSVIQNLLWPLYQSSEVFEVTLKKSSATTSSSNPKYSMDATLYTNNPISGSVGEASMNEVEFRNASQDGISRVFT